VTTDKYAKEAVSLLWEVRKLLMLLIAPGVDSVCFYVSRLQHKCAWCLVLGNGRRATQRSAQWIRAHPEQHLVVLVVAIQAGI
jgi:hypothetical protein